MKDNYQEKYNMDRDLIWEAYGVVYEQPHAQVEEIGSPDHPVLRQVRSIFQGGVGNTPEALAAQVAAVTTAHEALTADMERVKQEMRIQDKSAARGSAAPQQEQLQDFWKNKIVPAYTEIRQMVNALGQAGADVGTLMESLKLSNTLIVEVNTKFGLVEQTVAEDRQEDDPINIKGQPGYVSQKKYADPEKQREADKRSNAEIEDLNIKGFRGRQPTKRAVSENAEKGYPEEGIKGGTPAAKAHAEKMKRRTAAINADDAAHIKKYGSIAAAKKAFRDDAGIKENCGDVPMPGEETHDISNMDLSDLEIDRISDGDTEGRMAKKDLYKLAKYAAQLHNRIEDGEELEPWVQKKVAKAADYIGAVYHYMDEEEDRDEDDEHTHVELSDLEGIL